MGLSNALLPKTSCCLAVLLIPHLLVLLCQTIHNHFLHIFSSWLHQIFSSFISVIPPSPKPGNPKREDYEYRRYGVADLFVAFEPLAYKRVVKLTDTRTAVDFAHFLRDLTEVHYSHCEKIVLVMLSL